MAQQSVWQQIKDNVSNFRKYVEGKSDTKPADNSGPWKPPPGNRVKSHYTPPKWDTPKPASTSRTKTGGKRSGK